MKNLLSKTFHYLLVAVSLFVLSFLFTMDAGAEEYVYVRECSNGVCTVYVYTSEGALVNVYEELDNGG
jgi:hypothetical protein